MRTHKTPINVPMNVLCKSVPVLEFGYITFTNPSDYNTYEIITSDKLREPDPYEVYRFILGHISTEKQEELRDWLR
jgi:hypothetical protein